MLSVSLSVIIMLTIQTGKSFAKDTPVSTQPAVESEPSVPAVYLHAPGYEYAKKWDPLVAATVFRLLEIDLAASHGILAKYLPVGQPKGEYYPCLKISGEPLGKKEANTGAHRINVVLATKPGHEKTIASQDASWATFAEMTDHIKALSEKVKQALALELNLKLSKATKGSRITEQELAILNTARKKSLLVNSGEIWAASQMVNEVLEKKPGCPEAHYTAAMCGAMLAYQDLFGYFHARPRYLAKALSHWLFAEKQKLATPKRLEDKLAGGWVRYICGYPNEAYDVINSLSKKEQASSEASALTMFFTRDYRPLSKKVLKASPIQQLAWMYAIQDCGATAGLDDIPVEMAMKSRTCVFIPSYTFTSVGQDHRYTQLGISLAVAHDAYDLLTNDAIPFERRLAIGEELANALGVGREKPKPSFNPIVIIARTLINRNIDRLARRVSMAASMQDIEQNITPTLVAMMKLYDAAIDASENSTAGPVRQTISLRDFAEMQRAVLLMRIQQRLCFMAYQWAVNEEAILLGKAVAKGLASNRELQNYFDGFAIGLANEQEKQKTIAKSLLDSPLGELLTIQCGIVGEWAGFLGHKMDIPFKPGRGCWQWDLLIRFTRNKNNFKDIRWQSINMLLACDKYSKTPISSYIWKTKSFHCVNGIEKRLEYDLGLQTDIGWIAQSLGRLKYAEKYYKAAVKSKSPKAGSNSYRLLAELYLEMGKKDKAIETAIEAGEKLKHSVRLSNLKGELAVWLVDVGRLEEALYWGKKAARSYSAQGLNGLAVALEANGKIKEARKIFQAMAIRYDSCTNDYMGFLLRHDYPVDEIVSEIKALVEKHPNVSQELAKMISETACKHPKGVDVLQAAYKGPLSYVDKNTKQKQLKFCKANADWLTSKGTEFSVDSKNHEASPVATGIHLKKGQKFVLLPNPSDKWCGGGSRTGKYTGYRGYPKRGDWMKLFFKLKNSKLPVSPGNLIAINDGELIFYCSDDRVDDNKGKIRVKVLVSPDKSTQ